MCQIITPHSSEALIALAIATYHVDGEAFAASLGLGVSTSSKSLPCSSLRLHKCLGRLSNNYIAGSRVGDVFDWDSVRWGGYMGLPLQTTPGNTDVSMRTRLEILSLSLQLQQRLLHVCYREG
jgi:hypothetical protein